MKFYKEKFASYVVSRSMCQVWSMRLCLSAVKATNLTAINVEPSLKLHEIVARDFGFKAAAVLLPNLMAFDSLENHFMPFNMQIISTKVCLNTHTHTQTYMQRKRHL